MRYFLSVIGLFFLLQSFYSCIPVRIAPTIRDYKVVKGKKFKRNLSRRKMFVFGDPKPSNHFYNYVNTKFQLNDENVYDDVPFLIKGNQYFFAFYEIEISDKTLNLVPGLTNALANKLANSEGDEEYFSGQDVLRRQNWYIAIEVYSDSEKDCLNTNSFSRAAVLKYLSELKNEYLATHNYNEVIFKN
ncbi:hypothetical protein [uncultured Kriegella sp.]|uniref:hypothetical protein n=1 Tax=uncultured Kriegella sp. TaxID=1798910 RepID=UPI0030D8E39E|tara:strand:+ start:126006 stop:126569 length:564 start_codon:yes stop_codon:yes gene_type:complete